MSKHTQTPWHTRTRRHQVPTGLPSAWDVEIWGSENTPLFDIRESAHTRKHGEADSEFLCRAVNSHDQLVERLDECRSLIEAFRDEIDDVADRACTSEDDRVDVGGILADVKATLKAAKGEKQ